MLQTANNNIKNISAIDRKEQQESISVEFIGYDIKK